MKQAEALKILKAGRNVYLTGAAGSGKTHVLNEYISYLKDRGVSIGVTASTGIAATHIGGTTIHSWSGIGIKEHISEMDLDSMEGKKHLWTRFEKTQILLIDEVSMLSPQLLDNVNRVCKAMKRNPEPFGGMQVVLSGDFFQLPPIVRGYTEPEFAIASEAWREMDVRVCYLEEQFRQGDSTLESILNEIRGGSVSDKTRNILSEQTSIKGNITPTRLYTHNADVDELNQKELDKLPGTEYKFEMSSKGRATIISSLKKSILTSETLKLKKDAVVMFIKNNFEEGYVNGTLGVVKGFEDGMPVVKTFSGELIHVSPSEWSVEEDGKVLGMVEQLPLRLAWAITIHKSQGLSMDAAEIDLSKSFVPGQGYVALSRLRTLGGLLLSGINEMAFAVHPRVAQINEHLLKESEKWSKVIGRFSDGDMEKMHNDFVLKCGGTINKKEIEKNKNKKVDKVEEKISTYEKTRLLIEKGLNLKQLAKKRGVVENTILGHLEKLKEKDPKLDLSTFKPKQKALMEMHKAFLKSGDTKLSPVYKALKEKYSFEELRIARLFLPEFDK
ncbi:helix-turn-helix domain-containing protein [Patescibacteria group bacterium]